MANGNGIAQKIFIGVATVILGTVVVTIASFTIASYGSQKVQTEQLRTLISSMHGFTNRLVELEKELVRERTRNDALEERIRKLE